MAARRTAFVTAVACALGAGCLFPSFADLEPRRTGDDDDAGRRRDAGSSSSGEPAPTPPTATSDGGDEAAAPKGPKQVTCGEQICPLPSNFCCANLILGPDCMTEGVESSEFCASLNFNAARAVRCDGPEDCDGADVCCFVDAASEGARCRPTCAEGRVLCHGPGDCPAGKACGARILEDELVACEL